MTPIVALPIRSFSAMARLSPVLADDARAGLIRELAERALVAVVGAEAIPVVVTADPEVASWAEARAVVVVPDPGGGLDAAAEAGASFAGRSPWIVLHADLPGLRPSDVSAVVAALGNRPVLAPSKDGGTSAVAALSGGFPFRYGPGSFSRHLAAVAGRATILVRAGLAIDIDRPSDLAAWRRTH